MKTRVVFFHGYGSGSDSTKWAALRDNPHIDARLVEINYAHDDFDEIITRAQRHLTPNCIVVGHSIGALWARFFSLTKRLPCILLNPSFQPERNLTERLGDKFPIYCELSSMVTFARAEDKFVPLPQEIVLLEEGDNVINQKAVKVASQNSDFHILEGGSHRFESLNMIDTALKWIENRPWQ